jgi:xanthine dehydrogenase YagR molybdenum-binding subunit
MAATARAMRAPGHPQGALVMEQVMDDLADKIGMRPGQNFRIKKPCPRTTKHSRR